MITISEMILQLENLIESGIDEDTIVSVDQENGTAIPVESVIYDFELNKICIRPYE